MEIAGNQGENNRRRLLETRERITDGDCWKLGGE